MPYDLFMSLEQVGSNESFSSPQNMDKFRYLPQKPTKFNKEFPKDALPVGFVKDTYRGRTRWYELFKPSRDYIGYTCAACHTGQVDYKTPNSDPNSPATAIRIDGAPALADMVQFLTELEMSMKAVQKDSPKQKRFIDTVLKRKNDYRTKEQVIEDLDKWAQIIATYNQVNQSDTPYHFARLDAFGRIYNRVLQHTITINQARQSFSQAFDAYGNPMLKSTEVNSIFDSLTGDELLSDESFSKVISRLNTIAKQKPWSANELLTKTIVNEANAPVSYPFLWDVGQSDYVQWNGLAPNAGLGPLGRNAGEVIGVFGILDWEIRDNKMKSLSSFLTGQKDKSRHMTFNSSIDINNLRRLERTLHRLKSPPWPENIFPEIDRGKAAAGQNLYKHYCQSCHEVVDSRDAERLIIGKMFDIEKVKTDPRAAENGVNYKGRSGNFYETYQAVDDVGNVIVEAEAPVVQVLTAATKGVIATPDKDKLFIQRWADRIYNIFAALSENKIQPSVKAGEYNPDTSAQPYASLLAYKSRSLNGIWATSPYLHNGSVPTLYDLMLPSGCGLTEEERAEGGPYRPQTFYVGSRLFDTDKIGYRYDDDQFQLFDTTRDGNRNCGHEYGTGHGVPGEDGSNLPALTDEQRWQIIEYVKTLSLPKGED